MISLEKNFLFIHVPKTGGNSVQKTLIKYSDDKIVKINPKYHDGIEDFEIRNDKYKIHKHYTLTQYKSVLSPSIYDKVYKFTTIRNPWERMISFYFSPHRNTKKWDKKKFLYLLYKVSTLRNFIVTKSDNKALRKIEDLKYILKCPSKPLDSEIDFILRYENLEEDFNFVCNKLGIKDAKLPTLNKSEREHYANYYDKTLIEIVRKKFWEEIEFGDYKFGD